MIERILVPLDGSPTAEAVVPWAAELGRLSGASLTLLSCVAPGVWMDEIAAHDDPIDDETKLTSLVDDATTAAQHYLNTIAEQLRRTGSTVTTSLVYGQPATEIVQASQSVNLVALATHGRTGLARLVFGSVAEAVIQRAPVPVLVVRAHPTTAPLDGPLQRLLVPLDGSELAEHALPLAATLARQAGAELVLTHSTDWARELGLIRFGDPLVSRLIEQRSEVATDYLHSVSGRGQLHGLKVITDLRVTPAVESILTSVAEHQADLIVMSTHGRSGLGRWLLGSIAQQVVHQAPVPVLLVRATVPVRASEPQSALAQPAT